MKVIVRKATIENLKDIQKLNLMLFKKEYDEYDKFLNCQWTFGKAGTAYFKKRIIKDDGCAFIALINNNVVGYLVGGLAKAEKYRTLAKLAELENTFVLEEYRNLGVGTKLYQNFVSWCKKKKVKLLRVQASTRNLKAINFYRKNNFKDYTLLLESDEF